MSPSALLEPLEHAPEPLVLTQDQLDATDDMSDFTAKAKQCFAAEFAALGWGNTAAGELAELHMGTAA